MSSSRRSIASILWARFSGSAASFCLLCRFKEKASPYAYESFRRVYRELISDLGSNHHMSWFSAAPRW